MNLFSDLYQILLSKKTLYIIILWSSKKIFWAFETRNSTQASQNPLKTKQPEILWFFIIAIHLTTYRINLWKI